MNHGQIIVSDANILFDLLSVDLMDEFFLLPFDIATTDFVIHEIQKPEQLRIINQYIGIRKLQIASFDSDELDKILSIYSNNNSNTSITDCSVWYYAKKTGGLLLTGDKKLRKSAEKDRVRVSGILFIFDSLIEYGILDKAECAHRLMQLMIINKRMPISECETRIRRWS